VQTLLFGFKQGKITTFRVGNNLVGNKKRNLCKILCGTQSTLMIHAAVAEPSRLISCRFRGFSKILENSTYLASHCYLVPARLFDKFKKKQCQAAGLKVKFKTFRYQKEVVFLNHVALNCN
jgi:hypothetical protein